MLVTEYTNTGRAVKFIKDWGPAKMSSAYTPAVRNYLEDVNVDRRSRADMNNLQTALLRRS